MEDWKRVWCCASFGEILLIGEQLRINVHTAVPTLIKDRRYLFKTYTQSFLGNEVVSYLVDTKQAPNRDLAVIMMNMLQENHILHHVSDSSKFKDDNHMYRFTRDDETFPLEDDLAIVFRGKSLYTKLCEDPSPSLLQNHLDSASCMIYKNTFQGCHLVDWLVRNKEVPDREEAVKEARTLLLNGIIKHVDDSHHFKDEPLLYQFKIDFSREMCVLDLIIPPEPVETPLATVAAQEIRHLVTVSGSETSTHTGSSPESTAQDIPPNTKDRPSRTAQTSGDGNCTESGYHSDHHSSSTTSSYKEDSPTILSTSQDFDSLLNHIGQIQVNSPANSGAVVWRDVTAEELEDPDGNYVKRHFRIQKDPVGFGFVIRGEGPVYVKTVDPQGPAAQSGLKVGHFLYSVNDVRCLHMHHRELAHIILACNNLHLVVMVARDDSRKHHS